ncbi:MAG: T9SS type A sorting domain-containing protein [Bacteroidota bacterium]|nr:T9SS type A sorting domain-containing protein [Bacteroidota bacterium]
MHRRFLLFAITTLSMLVVRSECFAQTFSVTPMTMESQGKPGDFLEDAKAEVKNLTQRDLQIRIQRTRLVVPENWFVSFCLINCYSPDATDVVDVLPAGETYYFKPSFETSPVPGTGEVEYVLSSVENEAEKYTLVFRATTSITGVTGKTSVPRSLSLAQNYPNPFAVSGLTVTTIGYTVPKTGPVTIKVFNLLGREVCTLINETKNAGTYTVWWDGRDMNGDLVQPGIYIYKISSRGSSLTRRMVIAR